jgi:cytidyltransferase-like protein
MKVLVTGSFDMLHSGHIKFLKEASRFGELFVGIGSDFSIEKYKGHPPVCCERERLFMLEAIKYIKGCWVNVGEGSLDFKDEIVKEGINILVVNEDQASDAKENLCWDLGIKYIVLKRETEPGLPRRSSSEYRRYFE